MGIAAASPNIRTRIRAPRAAGLVGSIASLPAGVLWTADAGSINHWMEYDASTGGGASRLGMCVRYVDASNYLALEFGDFITATTLYGNQRIGGTNNFNVPGTTTTGQTVQVGDRFRLETTGVMHQFKILRAGAVIYQTALINAGSVPASTVIGKAAAANAATVNLTYGTL